MKKSRFTIKRISHRLTMVYAMLFFVALVSVNAATLLSVTYYMNQTSIQQLDSIDQALKGELKTLNDIQELDLNSIAQMNENIDINLIYDNKIIFKTGEQFDLPLPAVSLNSKIIQSIDMGGTKMLYLSDEISLSSSKVLSIQIIKDLDNDREFLHYLSLIMIIMSSFILVAAVLVGYIISKKALNPIDKITNQAKQISVSDLTKRIEVDGPDDELKRLSDTFNDLIARIEYSYEKQNQFALDASHELATPLAVIKGYVDLIDRWGKDDRKILDEGLLSIKKELSNMIKLLDTLLFMAKSDNEILNLEMTTFQFDDLIAELIKESQLVSGRHEILSDINEAILIKADRRLIKQMIRAIVDNSMKYTAGNGKIEISSVKLTDQIELTISDNGTGISKEELPKIFDRFYRVDRARSRALGGTGLGLSIVKWIVEIHGGTILVESEPCIGTKMVIHLPIGI